MKNSSLTYWIKGKKDIQLTLLGVDFHSVMSLDGFPTEFH